jgi:hypothetical protein
MGHPRPSGDANSCLRHPPSHLHGHVGNVRRDHDDLWRTIRTAWRGLCHGCILAKGSNRRTLPPSGVWRGIRGVQSNYSGAHPSPSYPAFVVFTSYAQIRSSRDPHRVAGASSPLRLIYFLRTGSRGTGCKRRGGTGPRGPSRTCPAGAGSGRRKPASDRHSVPSRLRRTAWWSTRIS